MKSALKSVSEAVAGVIVLPAVLLYRAGAAAVGPPRAFPGWSQTLSLAPGLGGAFLRRAFYRAVLGECSPGSWIGFGTTFSHPGARVGRGVYVGSFCCLGEVTLRDDVLLGSHVSIMNGPEQHGIGRLDVPIRDQPGTWRPVTVGEGSWVGERAVVMADVGRHCVIGAGAVVTRPIPDYSIAVGIPARVVRDRREIAPPADGPATDDQS